MIPANESKPGPIFEVLVRHSVDFVVIGGLAGIIHGSNQVTFDVDIVPDADTENLTRLSAALVELEARVRHPDIPEGLAFAHDAVSLAAAIFWNLTTPYGDLDISFTPAGTSGFADLVVDAERSNVFAVEVRVASLADVIRSKSAANRNKDKLALPALREALAQQERDRKGR